MLSSQQLIVSTITKSSGANGGGIGIGVVRYYGTSSLLSTSAQVRIGCCFHTDHTTVVVQQQQQLQKEQIRSLRNCKRFQKNQKSVSYPYSNQFVTTTPSKYQQQQWQLMTKRMKSTHTKATTKNISPLSATTSNINSIRNIHQHTLVDQKHVVTDDGSMKKTRKIFVVGAGVIGLRTTLEILRRSCNPDEKNIQIILHSPVPPTDPSVCSSGAGGLWMPFHVDDKYNRIDDWAITTFHELHSLGIDPTCDTVEIVPTVSLFQNHMGNAHFVAEPPPLEVDDNHVTQSPSSVDTTATESVPLWTQEPKLEFQHLTVEMLTWQNTVLKLKIPSLNDLFNAGYRHAWLFKPPIVDTTKYLQQMVHEIQTQYVPTGQIVMNLQTQKYYKNLNDICLDAIELGCDTVINCTGLGAREICNEKQQHDVTDELNDSKTTMMMMTGARGILHHYDRKNCIRQATVERCPTYGQQNLHDAVITTEEGQWSTTGYPCYFIPRGDTIIVGGSYLPDDTTTFIRPDEHSLLEQHAHYLGMDVERTKQVTGGRKGEWIGFRPYRKSIRCELDDTNTNHNDLDNDCTTTTTTAASTTTTNPRSVQVIHSYGYGGSGWTLFVGAAKYVADIILPPVR